MNKFVTFVATGGYAGFSPVIPGTVGTLLGLPLCFLFSAYCLPIYLLTTTALFFLGVWTAGRAEVLFGRKDSPQIVIDEILGYLVTMASVPLSPGAAFLGFLFFRLFDIIKPPPAGEIDRKMDGGVAVVLDDAVAGIYANVALHLFFWAKPEFIPDLDKWIYSFL